MKIVGILKTKPKIYIKCYSYILFYSEINIEQKELSKKLYITVSLDSFKKAKCKNIINIVIKIKFQCIIYINSVLYN